MPIETLVLYLRRVSTYLEDHGDDAGSPERTERQRNLSNLTH